MCANNSAIETLKLKLRSVTKQKLTCEREVYKLRNIDRCLTEDIAMTKNEIEYQQEQLREIQEQISQTYHQIAMVDICKSSERVKIEAHINGLFQHKEAFDDLFNREKEKAGMLTKGMRDKEAEEKELATQKQLQLKQKNEKMLGEVMAVEADAEALERECAVLKKRNAAIMLKLRRKLVENEDIRRELMKKKAEAESRPKEI